MIDEHLFVRMEKLRGRHTYGSNGPIYFLLEAGDYAYIDDRTKEERERAKIDRNAGVFFHGIKCIESKLARPGEPLAVVCNPEFTR